MEGTKWFKSDTFENMTWAEVYCAEVVSGQSILGPKWSWGQTGCEPSCELRYWLVRCSKKCPQHYFSLKVWFETSNRQNRQMEMRSHPCYALHFIFEWFVPLLTHVLPFILSLNGLCLFSPGLILSHVLYI